MPCLSKQCRSEEANWSGSALFEIKYVNFYQKPGSSNLIGWISFQTGVHVLERELEVAQKVVSLVKNYQVYPGPLRSIESQCDKILCDVYIQWRLGSACASTVWEGPDEIGYASWYGQSLFCMRQKGTSNLYHSLGYFSRQQSGERMRTILVNCKED